MKNKKIIIAKISVVIILILVMGLGLLKFIDFLSMPKTLFYSALETTLNDFNVTMNNLKKNDMYRLFEHNSMTINGDTKLSLSGLTNSKYAKYTDVLNKSRFITELKMDKNKKYLYSSINATDDLEKETTINYVDKDFTRFLKLSNDNKYSKLNKKDMYMAYYNVDKNIEIMDIIKSEIIKYLEDDKFNSAKEVIAVNNKTIKTNVNTYVFDGTTFNSIITNIINTIKDNKNLKTYLSNIYGIEEKDLYKTLLTEQKELKIDMNCQYYFNGYTMEDTDETVKFSIIEKDSNNVEKRNLISYEKILDYKKVFLQESTYIVDIKNNKKFIEFINKDYDVSVDYSKNKSKHFGDIKILNLKGDKLVEGTYELDMTKKVSNLETISLIIQTKNYFGTEIADLTINSSLLLKLGDTIEPENMDDAEENKYMTDLSTEEKIDKFLEIIYTDLK